MRTPIFKLDAFTRRRFSGNPAAVLPLAAFPPDHVMQAVAAENNLAETAPDLASIARLDRGGVVVTAPGDGPYDCVSGYFAPAKGIPEDPRVRIVSRSSGLTLRNEPRNCNV
jgi:predicted PhzF superfamily epimerase YddE/YHI9